MNTGKKKEDNLSSSAIKSGIGNLLSRISGFIRDVLLANYFGTGGIISAFLTAFTFPNMARRIFGEGALTASFIPMLSDALKNDKEDEWHFASIILSIATILTTVLSIIAIFICLIGSTLTEGQTQNIFVLSAWLMPFMVFICLSALLSGILNLLKSFTLPAVSSVLLNIFMIIACLMAPFFDIDNDLKIYLLVFATLLSGIAQFFLLFTALKKRGVKLSWRPNFKSPQWLSVKALFLPGILGASVTQLSVMSDRIIANFIGDYAVAALYYSERLIYFPVGIFAVALGVACLPFMSRAISNDDEDELMNALSFGLRQTFFLTIPCAALYFVYNNEIIAACFQRGKFNEESLKQCSLALLCYLPGIPAFSAVKILLPLYFARKDTRTPVKISIICFIVNLVLGISFIPLLEYGSLALATTISGYLNCILLISMCKHSNTQIAIKKLIPSFLRICIACSIATFGVTQLPFFDFSTCPIISLLIKMILTLLIFIVLNTIMGGKELKEIIKRKSLS